VEAERLDTDGSEDYGWYGEDVVTGWLDVDRMRGSAAPRCRIIEGRPTSSNSSQHPETTATRTRADAMSWSPMPYDHLTYPSTSLSLGSSPHPSHVLALASSLSSFRPLPLIARKNKLTRRSTFPSSTSP